MQFNIPINYHPVNPNVNVNINNHNILNYITNTIREWIQINDLNNINPEQDINNIHIINNYISNSLQNINIYVEENDLYFIVKNIIKQNY